MLSGDAEGLSGDAGVLLGDAEVCQEMLRCF